jgi:hypothetical protein
MSNNLIKILINVFAHGFEQICFLKSHLLWRNHFDKRVFSFPEIAKLSAFVSLQCKTIGEKVIEIGFRPTLKKYQKRC